MSYTSYYSKLNPKQDQVIPGKEAYMVSNSDGAKVFAVSLETRLKRFLILGSESPTYYSSAKDLTVDNAKSLEQLFSTNPETARDIIIQFVTEGRVKKINNALFATAIMAGSQNKEAATYALRDVAPKIVKTGRQLLDFTAYLKHFRGRGRSVNAFTSAFYKQDLDQLVYQVLKYKASNKLSHKNLLGYCRVKPDTPERDYVFGYLTGKEKELTEAIQQNKSVKKILDYQKIHSGKLSFVQVLDLVKDNNFTWEMVPTQYLNDAATWEALIDLLPYQALIRQLPTMTRSGFLAINKFDTIKKVMNRIQDEDHIKKSRIHPIALLNAWIGYRSGQSKLSNKTWSPVPQINAALENAFYKSFHNVDPIGQNIMVSLDVSGSMTWAIGKDNFSPRQGSSAMALLYARTEPNVMFNAFSDDLTSLDINQNSNLDEVLRKVDNLPFSSTDCSLPILEAIDKNYEIDLFIIFTDSETNHYRSGHPSVLLEKYNRKTGRNAKMVVIGMVSNGFSLADPTKGNMLDVVGFDPAVPTIIKEFANGLV